MAEKNKECTREESCKYLHRELQKENEEDAKNEDPESNATSEKVEKLEEALASKDDETEKLETFNLSLSTENELIKEEVQNSKELLPTCIMS